MKIKTILPALLLALAASASQSTAQVTQGGPRPTRLLPDLKVSLVSAKGSKAVVRVANVCRGDAGPAEVNLTVYYGANKQSHEAEIMNKKSPTLAGTATPLGQRTADLVFTLGANSKVNSFDGKFIRVQGDRTNAIKEASENNNWFERGEGAAQPFPEAGGYCGEEVTDVPKPSIKLKGVSQSGGSSTTYTFAVSGWNNMPFDWLTGTTTLGVKCGDKSVFARILARVYTVNGTATQEAGCVQFNKSDLDNLNIVAAGIPGESSKVKLVIEDRTRKTRYPSALFDVEPFTMLNGLNSLGCKTFLGNPKSFLCTTDSGFKSCEDLRKGGKVAKCTRAGNQ